MSELDGGHFGRWFGKLAEVAEGLNELLRSGERKGSACSFVSVFWYRVQKVVLHLCQSGVNRVLELRVREQGAMGLHAVFGFGEAGFWR